MVTVQDFRRVVKETTYKPGYALGIAEPLARFYPETGLVEKKKEVVAALRVHLPDMPDSIETETRPFNGVFTVSITQAILDMLDNELDILKWIQTCIHSWETHEADEWLKYRGERIFNPHLKKLEVVHTVDK